MRKIVREIEGTLENLGEKSKDNLMLEGCDDRSTDLASQIDARIDQVCGAWKTADDAARDVWGSIHKELLKGDLVFGYRSTSPGTNLQQLVVVRNVNWETGYPEKDSYAIGVIYAGYTMHLPKVPMEYLQTVLRDDLKKEKVGTQIIESYEYMINAFK